MSRNDVLDWSMLGGWLAPVLVFVTLGLRGYVALLACIVLALLSGLLARGAAAVIFDRRQRKGGG